MIGLRVTERSAGTAVRSMKSVADRYQQLVEIVPPWICPHPQKEREEISNPELEQAAGTANLDEKDVTEVGQAA